MLINFQRYTFNRKKLDFSVSKRNWLNFTEQVNPNMLCCSNSHFFWFPPNNRLRLLTQNSLLGTMFLIPVRYQEHFFVWYQEHCSRHWKIWIFGIMNIVPNNIRYNVPDTKMFFLLLPGIYIQIGIDCNQFTAGKKIDSD